MKNITIIAAVGKNLELGKDNDLIWHFKGDMRFFREHTLHKPIIMGRKTLESLPGLLPERQHIVLSLWLLVELLFINRCYLILIPCCLQK